MSDKPDLTCPICSDIFQEPVILLCSHSFCKGCLSNWWTKKPSRECPVCKVPSSLQHPPRNLALKHLCEAHVQSHPEEICDLHSEKLKLFCLHDLEPICVVCRDSSAHKDHGFKPVIEAATENRDVIHTSLQPLEEKLKILREFNICCAQTVDHIKKQAQDTQKQIREDFKKLHQFLVEDEETRIMAVKEEEAQKIQSVKTKMEAVSREIKALSETIKATEDQLRATDVSFLLEYKASVERVQLCPLQEEPQLAPEALLDQAKHLGNLIFNIWTSMKKLVEYRPFVLDPNTAQGELLLSSDLTSVSHDTKKNLPDNPERFDKFLSVLGSEAFDSGAHSWVVVVEKNSNWLLGVVSESFQRKGSMCSDSGLWRISLCGDECYAFSTPNVAVKLSLKNKPTKIRITLDFKKWKLSFCDADTKACIHTFTYNFKEKIYPFFNTTDKTPLRIEPQEPPENKNSQWWWFY